SGCVQLLVGPYVVSTASVVASFRLKSAIRGVKN
ncbi:molybdopterin adenylyltransferase, partial [Cronobacter sakazakii]